MNLGEARACEYDRDDREGLRVAAILAMDRLASPELKVEILASRGDHLTARIVDGALAAPDKILYIERRGTF